MEQKLKLPKTGAVARLRESYLKRRRESKPSPELLEILENGRPNEEEEPKKIAKQDQDAEM